jgi:hypothetical protein
LRRPPVDAALENPGTVQERLEPDIRFAPGDVFSASGRVSDCYGH